MEDNLMRELIDALWENIEYWKSQDDFSVDEKLEGVVFATLCSIDGVGTPVKEFKLVYEDEENNEKTEIDGLHKWSEENFKKYETTLWLPKIGNVI